MPGEMAIAIIVVAWDDVEVEVEVTEAL